MASSLAPLQRRAEKLRSEIEALRARRQTATGALRSTLPGADRWPDFAKQTWIKTQGSIKPFIPYDFQIDLIEKIHNNPNVIVNKSRQLGVSETVVSYLGDRAATEPGFAAIIFSKTQIDSSNLARRVRFMLNSIQGHNFVYDSDSNTLISLKNGGTLYFLPGSARAARGIPSGSVLWLDEAAFIEGVEEIYRAASPALSMLGDAGKVIVTCTPDLELDFFGSIWNYNIPPDWYDYVKQAKANPKEGPRYIAELNQLLATIDDDWTRVAIHYSQHPVYNSDLNWAEKTRKSRKLTQAVWNSEYELAFGSTDAQVFPSTLITRGARGSLHECGHIGRTYVIGIDPNAGGSDYFVALVLDITTKPYQVVSMYRQNGKSTAHSLKHIKTLVEDFLPDRVIIEKQAMGAVIGEALQGILPEYQIEYFNTTRPSKITATDRVLFFLEHDDLIYPPGPIVNDLRAFRQVDGGGREAAPGHNDDIVMALAFACSAVPETPNSGGFFDAL